MQNCDNKFSFFTYAFQPIVDINTRKVFSQEALLRGLNNEPASFIFSQIPKNKLLEFDQLARNKALELAGRLGITSYINLNFMPGCLEDSNQYIVATLDALNLNSLSHTQLVVEITEENAIHDYKKFVSLINQYRKVGVKVAIDDFGAGYSGLNLLVNFQPDMIKLDMQLIRNIHSHGPRQAIVCAIIDVCTKLGIDIIAEGIETLEEYNWLKKHEINLFQGYLFAKPGFECLPAINFPE